MNDVWQEQTRVFFGQIIDRHSSMLTASALCLAVANEIDLGNVAMSMEDLPLEPGARGSRRIQAVDHAIDVLEVMAFAGRPIGVSDLARQTNLSKATVHHLLATLENRRFVMRDSDSALYKLSWALYELGSNVVRDVDLSRIARPYLDKLAVQTGESVLLGILDGDSVLYLDRGEAPAGLQMRANAGRRGPLHATASGKVLLAFATDGTLLARILGEPLEKLTKTTITDPATLRLNLAQARQQGYATCWQEREVGLCSVAVPLHDYRSAVVGCLTVAGPATRLTTRTLQAHLAPLQSAVRHIEAHLGAPSVDSVQHHQLRAAGRYQRPAKR